MATDLLKTVTEQLNEEKWTRATLNSYSISNFKELDVLIEQEPHEPADTRRSSPRRTSMAYRTQARMSSPTRAG